MFKSERQREKFKELLKDGKISQKTFDEFTSKTTGKLPDKLPSKSKTGVRTLRRVK